MLVFMYVKLCIVYVDQASDQSKFCVGVNGSYEKRVV